MEDATTGPRSRLDLLHELTDRLEYTERFFEAFLAQAPLAMWLKDYSAGRSRMVFVSDEYCRVFNVAASRYVGRPDEAIWPAEVAAKFREQDMEVIESGGVVVREEPTPLATLEEWKMVKSYKFPIRTPRGDVIGVGGIAWPSNHEQ